MAKLELATLASGYLDVSKLNENFAKITVWADSVLSRTGDSPNQMEADFDLNGHTILNLEATGQASSILTYGQMQEYVDAHSQGLIRQQFQSFTATAGQTVIPLTAFTYVPDSGNLAVYKNGIRQFSPTQYVETNSSTITFVSGLALNDKIQVVSNEFLATVVLPSHQHPWSQIFDVPVYTTRWPTYAEVSGKPTTFTPAPHSHATTDITSGNSFADTYRGVFVQSAQPTATRTGDLWLW